MLPTVDPLYVCAVCRIGRGAACCRYLVGGPDGVACAKEDDELRQAIDRRAGSMTAQADNCPGYLHLPDEET
jgi:hypothetical protein